MPLDEVLGVAERCEAEGRYREAERWLGRALAAHPDDARALHLSGVVTLRLGDPDKALALMQRALRDGLAEPLYWRNIGELYRMLGRLDEARGAALRAAQLAPTDPLVLSQLSLIAYHRLELDDALAYADQALRLDPGLAQAHFARAEALLLSGEWAQGWEEYEWRFRLPGVAAPTPPGGKPPWDGRPLTGETLLLIADQGYGDVVQFSRYIPWAAARCPDIAVACAAEMAPLLRQLWPGLRLFQRWEDCPHYAMHCPLSGLPRLAGARPDTVAGAPYLKADPGRAAEWRRRLDRLAPAGYARVGIVWAGRPTHNNDRRRSASLAAFAPLAQLDRTALIALQKGPAAAEAGGYFGRAPLVNLGPEIADFEDTLAILDGLDLVVTVDTAVAHIAGALRRPAWIALSRVPDWRWLLGRQDTPWYGSVRLFRQSTLGEWDDPVGRIAEEARRALINE